jgi:hypothetical protein
MAQTAAANKAAAGDLTPGRQSRQDFYLRFLCQATAYQAPAMSALTNNVPNSLLPALILSLRLRVFA